MSLMKTLTQVAIGIAVAKGVQHISGRAGAGTATAGTGRSYAPDAGGLGNIMEEILGAGKTTRSGTTTRSATPSGGLEDLLGSLIGSGTQRSRTTAPSGGLGDLLSGQAGSGGIGDLLGAVLGGGAMGGALGGLTDALTGGQSGGQSGSIARPQITPEVEQEAEAAVLLRAMIMAAKADAKLDEAEKAQLLGSVGDASKAEIAFINRELSAPVDVEDLLKDVPRGMEEKVYMASVMAIRLDEQAEAKYLHTLAQALGLNQQEVNALHDHMKAPRIYA
ncbi:MAG: tellurite resistance TerB family protein [Rhodobacteraceae bacterium]|nr:tellurite resistance TerB family protein [Paracoccaceae bacterium]